MADEFCPRCGTKRLEAFRYCRSCQFDFESIGAKIAPERVAPERTALAATPPSETSASVPPPTAYPAGAPTATGPPSGIARHMLQVLTAVKVESDQAVGNVGEALLSNFRNMRRLIGNEAMWAGAQHPTAGQDVVTAYRDASARLVPLLDRAIKVFGSFRHNSASGDAGEGIGVLFGLLRHLDTVQGDEIPVAGVTAESAIAGQVIAATPSSQRPVFGSPLPNLAPSPVSPANVKAGDQRSTNPFGRWWGSQSRRTRWIIAIVVALFILGSVENALGMNKSSNNAAAPSATGAQAAQAPAAPTSGAGVKVVALGQPQRVSDQLQVTVEDIQSPASVTAFGSTQTPPSGESFLFVKVRYDGLQDGAPYSSADWQVYANHQGVGPALILGGTPTPALVIGTITKGNFAEGWLYYEVPSGSQVALQYKVNLFASTPTFEVDYTAP